MKENNASIRGRILREVISTVNSTNFMEKKFKSGELRKNLKEPLWLCPGDYTMEEITMPEFTMEWLTRNDFDMEGEHMVILQLHGGGYVGAMTNIYRFFAVLYSEEGKGIPVLSTDYRVAPENPYPAALEDALSSYEWLLEKGYRPDQIVVAGDSAGGGLTLALCLYLRDHGRELPCGIITMSAWKDLTAEGDSYTDNFEIDPLFGKTKESLLFDPAYIGEGTDPKDPYVSPVFGDFTGFPPMLMQVGDYEMLLSDTLTIAKKAAKQGVKVKRTVYRGMFHVFQMALRLMPESRRAWREVGRFLDILSEIRKQ